MDLDTRANALRLLRLPAAVAERANPPVSAAHDRAAAEERRPLRRRAIAAHARAGPYSLFHIPESDPASMVAVMDRTGVDQAVLSTNRAIQEDSRRGNDETAAAVDA